jgi:hypothetical protein
MVRTKYEKMAYMRGAVESWISKGLGSGQAYREYEVIRARLPEEARIRKTDFLSVYREWQGEERKRDPFKSLGLSRKPSEGMVMHTFLTVKRPYTYEGYVDTEDELGRPLYRDEVRIGFSELLSKDQVINEIINRWMTVLSRGYVVGVELTGIRGVIL